MFDHVCLADDDPADLLAQIGHCRLKRADQLTHFVRFENFFLFCRHALYPSVLSV